MIGHAQKLPFVNWDRLWLPHNRMEWTVAEMIPHACVHQSGRPRKDIMTPMLKSESTAASIFVFAVPLNLSVIVCAAFFPDLRHCQFMMGSPTQRCEWASSMDRTTPFQLIVLECHFSWNNTPSSVLSFPHLCTCNIHARMIGNLFPCLSSWPHWEALGENLLPKLNDRLGHSLCTFFSPFLYILKHESVHGFQSTSSFESCALHCTLCKYKLEHSSRMLYSRAWGGIITK